MSAFVNLRSSATKCNVIDVDDILSADFMPGSLLMLDNPEESVRVLANSSLRENEHQPENRMGNHTLGRVGLGTDGSIMGALHTMVFHRGKMNEYLCRNFIAEQIIEDMSIARIKKRQGFVDKRFKNATVSPNHRDYSLRENMIEDEGSSQYKSWLTKSATLEDVYRHYQNVERREDEDDEDDDDDEKEEEEQYDQNIAGYAYAQPHGPVGGQLPVGPAKVGHSASGLSYPSSMGYGYGASPSGGHGPAQYGHGAHAGHGYPSGHGYGHSGPPLTHHGYDEHVTVHHTEIHHDVPKHHGGHDGGGKDLGDMFEMALTALAYLSFGMFIVHVVMCISHGKEHKESTVVIMQASSTTGTVGTDSGMGMGMGMMPGDGSDDGGGGDDGGGNDGGGDDGGGDDGGGDEGGGDDGGGDAGGDDDGGGDDGGGDAGGGDDSGGDAGGGEDGGGDDGNGDGGGGDDGGGDDAGGDNGGGDDGGGDDGGDNNGEGGDDGGGDNGGADDGEAGDGGGADGDIDGGGGDDGGGDAGDGIDNGAGDEIRFPFLASTFNRRPSRRPITRRPQATKKRPTHFQTQLQRPPTKTHHRRPKPKPYSKKKLKPRRKTTLRKAHKSDHARNNVNTAYGAEWRTWESLGTGEAAAPTARSVRRRRRRRRRRKRRAVPRDAPVPTLMNPNLDGLNELARHVLTSIEAALVAHQDDGACLRRVLCQNNRSSRSMANSNKMWIPVWSLGMSWLSGKLTKDVPRSTSMLDALKASVLGLGKANCEVIFQDCNLQEQRNKRRRRRRK